MGNWIPYGREESIPVYSLSGENVNNPQAKEKREQISIAEEGFNYFYDRDFKKAHKCFGALSVSGEMEPFQIVERICKEYGQNPPGANWNKAFQMYGK